MLGVEATNIVDQSTLFALAGNDGSTVVAAGQCLRATMQAKARRLLVRTMTAIAASDEQWSHITDEVDLLRRRWRQGFDVGGTLCLTHEGENTKQETKEHKPTEGNGSHDERSFAFF